MGIGWSDYTLGNLCRFKYGQMPRKTDLCDDGYPVFSGYHIVGYATTYHYEEPEIIVVARGVGGTGDVKMSPPKCFLTNLSIVVKVVSSEVDKKFLYYRLAGPKLWELRTGSAQAQITIERLQRYELRLPPLSTQRKIAAILSVYDDLIENNLRRIKILEEIAQNLYTEWFVKFRFPGHEKVKITDSPLGRIPEGWVIGQIKDIVAVKSGFAFSSKTFDEKGKYQLVTIRNVQDGFFVEGCQDKLDDTPSNLSDYCYLNDGDILLSLTGNVGRVCLVYGSNYLLNQRVAKLVPVDHNNKAFIYTMFRNSQIREILERLSTGVAQQNLSPVKTGEMQIIMPPPELLKMYSQLENPIFQKILILFKKNSILHNTRDLLLPRLISGELDVSNLDIEMGDDE